MNADEEEILKERLITRETVFLSRSAKKALEKYAAIYKDEKNKTGALCELELFSLDVERCGAQAKACSLEKEESLKEKIKMQKDIKETSDEIQDLRKLLTKEKVIRRRKEEYEALGKIVNQNPSQAQTALAIDTVAAQTAAIEAEISIADTFLRKKAMQYDLLLQTIDDLTHTEIDQGLQDSILETNSHPNEDLNKIEDVLMLDHHQQQDVDDLVEEDERLLTKNASPSSGGQDDDLDIPKKRRGTKHKRSEEIEPPLSSSPPPRSKQRTSSRNNGNTAIDPKEEAGEINEEEEEDEQIHEQDSPKPKAIQKGED